MFNKKGAMFGLDARIALAIFGALSVISGAALYSAIQEAKLVSIITQIKEIEKAYEDYYLSNAGNIEMIGSSTSNIDLSKLIEAGHISLDYKKPNSNDNYFEKDQIYYRIVLYQESLSDTFGGLTGTTSCNGADTCYAYLTADGPGLTADMIDKIDLRIDGVSSDTSGKIKVYVHNSLSLYLFKK
tara:strand:+ start:190 stop:744 length:555 start_codon:yes stop_codon:yes gene_type:complete